MVRGEEGKVRRREGGERDEDGREEGAMCLPITLHDRQSYCA